MTDLANRQPAIDENRYLREQYVLEGHFPATTDWWFAGEAAARIRLAVDSAIDDQAEGYSELRGFLEELRDAHLEPLTSNPNRVVVGQVYPLTLGRELLNAFTRTHHSPFPGTILNEIRDVQEKRNPLPTNDAELWTMEELIAEERARVEAYNQAEEPVLRADSLVPFDIEEVETEDDRADRLAVTRHYRKERTIFQTGKILIGRESLPTLDELLGEDESERAPMRRAMLIAARQRVAGEAIDPANPFYKRMKATSPDKARIIISNLEPVVEPEQPEVEEPEPVFKFLRPEAPVSQPTQVIHSGTNINVDFMGS